MKELGIVFKGFTVIMHHDISCLLEYSSFLKKVPTNITKPPNTQAANTNNKRMKCVDIIQSTKNGHKLSHKCKERSMLKPDESNTNKQAKKVTV